jgi:hypothetical protein
MNAIRVMGGGNWVEVGLTMIQCPKVFYLKVEGSSVLTRAT